MDVTNISLMTRKDEDWRQVALADVVARVRNFIRAAQQNYCDVDKAGFIYADTDSIHCDHKLGIKLEKEVVLDGCK